MTSDRNQELRDATFEEGGEAPLHLMAVDAEDLAVIAALVQDAIFPAGEMKWLAGQRRFAILLNRFRWEDQPAAERQNRPYERVQALMIFDDVQKVSSQGIARNDKELVLSLLDISFEAGEDGSGRLILTLAGDGAIALEVESLNVTLKDVTKPYVAPSRKAPHHPE